MDKVYIKFTDDHSDSLTHYGVKGMKWHKHLKSKIQDEVASRLEDRLLGREREFETKYAAYGSSSKAERSIAKTALKAREESKKRKTLKYKISNSVLSTKKNAISKGKGVYDKLRNKKESSTKKALDKAVTNAKKAYIKEKTRDAARKAAGYKKTNTPNVYYKEKKVGKVWSTQTGVRGTRKSIYNPDNAHKLDSRSSTGRKKRRTLKKNNYY